MRANKIYLSCKIPSAKPNTFSEKNFFYFIFQLKWKCPHNNHLSLLNFNSKKKYRHNLAMRLQDLFLPHPVLALIKHSLHALSIRPFADSGSEGTYTLGPRTKVRPDRWMVHFIPWTVRIELGNDCRQTGACSAWTQSKSEDLGILSHGPARMPVPWQVSIDLSKLLERVQHILVQTCLLSRLSARDSVLKTNVRR